MSRRNRATSAPGRWLAVAALCLPALVGAQPSQVPQPSPGLMPNAARGKALYAQNCASCHGTDLQGTDQGPPFLHRIYEPSHHGDAAFQLAVRNGVRAHHWKFGDMKPVPGLSADDVAHIVAYVRSQQRLVGIR